MLKNVFWFFPSNGTIGGAERRFLRIIQRLDENNVIHRVIVNVIGNVDVIKLESDLRRFSGDKIEFVFFHSNIKLFEFLITQTYDYICYTDCYFRTIPVITAALLRHRKRVLLSVTTYASSLNNTYIKNQLYKIIVWISNRVDCLYPSSLDTLKKVFPKKNITLTPGSFTDYDAFLPSNKKEKTIVFAGRLIDAKNPELMIKAINLIDDFLVEKGYTVLICGEGPLMDHLSALSSSVVKFMGNVNLMNVLASSHIFCSLQRHNNYPSQVLLEAMACGNYCIVTDDGDSHLMITSDFGKLIKHNENELANSIVSAILLLENHGSQKEIAIAARRYAMNNYNIEASVDYFNKMFDE